MTATTPRQTTVDLGFVTELTVADETVNLILEKVQDREVTVFRGGMVAGQRLLLVALLEELLSDAEFAAPVSLQNLAITQMAVELRPEKGVFAFDAAIENVWSIALDSGPTIAIERLAVSVLSIKPPQSRNASNPGALTTAAPARQRANELAQQRKLTFAGDFFLFGGEFAVQVTHQFVSSTASTGGELVANRWTLAAIAENISITEIIKAFGFSQDQVDEFGLRDLRVTLAFTYDQTRYRENQRQFTDTQYTFRGELLWDTGIELVPGEETLQIEAAVQIAKTSSTRPDGAQSALQGEISGTVRATIPFFDTLQLSVSYQFTQTRSASRNSSALAQRSGELIFHLQISTLLLSAVYTTVPDPKSPNDPQKNRQLLTFSVSLVNGNNPTVGDLIAYVVSLYDPSIIDFELDPPWDELTNQEIALDKFSLEVDLTRKALIISYQTSLNVLIAEISDIGLSYQFGADPSTAQRQRQSARSASNKKVAIAVNLSIPGQPKKRLTWDPVNENPPKVPSGKAPIFELQFLALGQRVAFAPEIIQQARTVEQFTNVMRQSLVPLPPIKRRQNPLTALQGSLPSVVSSDPTQPISFTGQPIQFSAESGWLIGTQFVILGAIDLSLIFNDPFVYGLRLSLDGPIVKSFAGLEFEILYRRLSDNLGVYRAELTLPDAMRQFQVGIVSFTLPTVAVAIYTNGDFEIDVGFPWQGNFDRSIAVEVIIFLGLGGFYFNKLSAATATSTPSITDGVFDPVIEFGIGLRVGLGRTLRKGPLRAEVSITKLGILQGVFAVFKPTDNSRDQEIFFRVQGTAGIVGRIYGVVDFKVITVDVEVVVEVFVQFVVEVHKAIELALVARVSVRASIKVAFVRVRFKFGLTIREEFKLGSDSTPPWQLAPASGGAMAAPLPVFAASAPPVPKRSRAARAFSRTERSPAQPLNRHRPSPVATAATPAPVTVSATSTPLASRLQPVQFALPDYVTEQSPLTDGEGHLRFDIFFQVGLTRAETTADATSTVAGVALLFIENSLDQAADQSSKDFDELAKLLLKWVIYSYHPTLDRASFTAPIAPDNIALTQLELEAMYTDFVEDLEQSTPDELWTPLIAFLEQNVVFDITAESQDDEINGTIFPMIPQLTLVRQDGENQAIGSVAFDDEQEKLTLADAERLQDYFQALLPNHDQATDESLALSSTVTTANSSRPTLSFAQFLFLDYFTLIMRSALQNSIDTVRDTALENDPITLADLLAALGGSGTEPSASALQELAGMTSRFMLHGLRLPLFENDDVVATRPAYVATRQQFSLQVPGEAAVAALSLQKSGNTLPWIRFSGTTATAQSLNYDLGQQQELIDQLQAVDLSTIPWNDRPLAIAPFYGSTPQRYALRQQQTWQTPDGEAHQLWKLPADLSDYLKTKPTAATISLHYTAAGRPGEAISPTAVAADATPEYRWGTQFNLNVRRIARVDGNGFLPTVYALAELDTVGERSLQAFLNSGDTPTALHLLYLDDTGETTVLTQQATAAVALLKTNLALASADTDRLVALDASTPATFTPFLQLIQESSRLNNVGYWLTYRDTTASEPTGLPDALFTDGETAQLTVLLLFGSDPRSDSNCLHIPASHPDSGAIANAGAVNSTHLFFAESSQTLPVLKIPSGNLGFNLLRKEPEENAAAATDELATLYQLLYYEFPRQDKASLLEHFGQMQQERLPLGPVEIEGNETDWRYEKILPIYQFAPTAEADANALPLILKQTANPYNSIGQPFKLDFRWQDIYGNRLGDAGDILTDIDLAIGYFDPILGINQWPSVGESYFITPHSNSTAQITLELNFNQGKYIPTPAQAFAEVADQIKADRALYQQIYYQVHDPNLTFTLTTSVIPAWSAALTGNARSPFTQFVDDAYRYLVTLEFLQEFALPAEATVRPLHQIAQTLTIELADLADMNGDRPGIFSSNGPLQVPVSFRINASVDSLQTIAEKLVPNGTDPQAKVEEIVRTYAQTADLIDSEVVQPQLAFAQPGDTFEALAIAQLAQEEDDLVAAAVAAIAAELAEQPGILAVGTLFQTLDDRQKIAFDTTLEEIAANLLQQAGDDLLPADPEAAISQKVDELLSQPENLALPLRPGIVIPSLGDRDDYVVQAGDTLSTLQQVDDGLSSQVLREAIRDIRTLFAAGGVLTSQTTVDDEIATVLVLTVAENRLQAIATLATQSNSLDALTVVDLITANLTQPDLLIADQAILLGGADYPVKPQDSFRRLAMVALLRERGITDDSAISRTVTVEVASLEYEVALTAQEPPLLELTDRLNRATNHHRTVLETVRVVGNMREILSPATLTAQLNIVASRLQNIPGLLGDTDVVLADVSVETPLDDSQSLNQLIADLSTDQILTDQTTAGDVAVRNAPTVTENAGGLSVKANVDLILPDRFEIAPIGLSASQLALTTAPSTATTLANLASQSGNGVTVAAIAIANQTLANRLSPTEITLPPVVAQLLGLNQAAVEALLTEFLVTATERISASPILSVASTDTLYTLTAKLEQILETLKQTLNQSVEAVQPPLGAITAIHEQLTNLTGANRAALRELLDPAIATSPMAQLQSELLAADGTLKLQHEPSPVHFSGDSVATAITDEVDAIQAAIADLITAHAALDETLIATLETSLAVLHRMFDRSNLKLVVELLEQRSRRPLTVAEVGVALQQVPGLVAPGQRWIVPPAPKTVTQPVPIGDDENSVQYPEELLFSVDVQVTMSRPQELIHGQADNTLTPLPDAAKRTVESVAAYFSPKTIEPAPPSEPTDNADTAETDPENGAATRFSDRVASLTPFATAFEQAFPNLKLAVGRNEGNIDSTNPSNSDTVWAVHLGPTGIHYNIQEDFPFFFSIAPLSNTLMSGAVPVYAYTSGTGLSATPSSSIQANAVDLNRSARTFLQAIEDVLSPAIAGSVANDTTPISKPGETPTTVTAQGSIERLLTVKSKLADTISQQVTHILQTTLNPETAPYTDRRNLAVAALHKELLTHLADAYDIETIVQYNVDIEFADANYRWPETSGDRPSPRLSGQPMMTGAYFVDDDISDNLTPNAASSLADQRAFLQTLDFALSPAKLTLDTLPNTDKSALTFFFNTQTPQRYEGIAVNLTYQVNELEYNINPETATSSWLNFVVPLNEPGVPTPPTDPNHIGDVQIPIPLRDYPMPPALITHKAVPDPDGFSGDILSAEDIRDWNYVFLYEHPDIAQDTVECRIDYNVDSADNVPMLVVDDAIAREPTSDGSSVFLVFTVRLFPPSPEPVTVSYRTQAGTATEGADENTPGADYVGVSGELTFEPGEITKTIPVQILQDSLLEEVESFQLVLSGANGATIQDPDAIGTIIDAPLLDTLVQFHHVYPAIARDLDLIETGITEGNRSQILLALDACATLAERVEQAWARWQAVLLTQTAPNTTHYTIDETRSFSSEAGAEESVTTVVKVSPTVQLSASDQQILKVDLPGNRLTGVQQNNVDIPPLPAAEEDTDAAVPPAFQYDDAQLTRTYDFLEFIFESLADTTGIETFGESALPDRKVTVINLDILAYQSAWAAIQLTRNKNLITGRDTNPAFLFPTPAVRFKNPVTPLVINNKRWDIALLSTPNTVDLADHLQALFNVLLPQPVERSYDLIIACQYAFALAVQTPGELSADDLLAKLPVLLTPRFTVEKPDARAIAAAQQNGTYIHDAELATRQLRLNLAAEIEDWWRDQQAPNETNGRFIFSVSLLSDPTQTTASNPNLPLLVIENLELKLSNIRDRNDWYQGSTAD
ncbi:MAG: hypothetical protein F6K00_20875 [Leptolyngbya sp. SIOISBB]|nr:hypothetical protein [Leptolyngbya sp. SIOISBB]